MGPNEGVHVAHNGNGGGGDVGTLKEMFVVKRFNFWRGFRKALRRQCNTCCSFTVMPLCCKPVHGEKLSQRQSIVIDGG